MRAVQLVLAIFGIGLLLHNGIVRVPGLGEGSSAAPVHWEWHTAPALIGILCIVVALGLIFTRDRA